MWPLVLGDMSLLDHNAIFRCIRALQGKPILQLIPSLAYTFVVKENHQLFGRLNLLRGYYTELDGVL